MACLSRSVGQSATLPDPPPWEGPELSMVGKLRKTVWYPKESNNNLMKANILSHAYYGLGTVKCFTNLINNCPSNFSCGGWGAERLCGLPRPSKPLRWCPYSNPGNLILATRALSLPLQCLPADEGSNMHPHGQEKFFRMYLPNLLAGDSRSVGGEGKEGSQVNFMKLLVFSCSPLLKNHQNRWAWTHWFINTYTNRHASAANNWASWRLGKKLKCDELCCPGEKNVKRGEQRIFLFI